MLHIIISSDSDLRIKKRAALLRVHQGEPIVLDDMSSSLSQLEQYMYPSLFSIGTTVVHGKYLLEEYAQEATAGLFEKLVQSPTIFILEEKALTTVLLKTIEKYGGTVHQEKIGKAAQKQTTIFSVATAVTAKSKKERWLSYREARTEHAPEAIIAILYWKLRDLIEKSGLKNKEYGQLYRALMEAHKRAWQKGFPLDVAIEKVILQ